MRFSCPAAAAPLKLYLCIIIAIPCFKSNAAALSIPLLFLHNKWAPISKTAPIYSFFCGAAALYKFSPLACTVLAYHAALSLGMRFPVG